MPITRPLRSRKLSEVRRVGSSVETFGRKACGVRFGWWRRPVSNESGTATEGDDVDGVPECVDSVRHLIPAFLDAMARTACRRADAAHEMGRQ